MDIEVNIDDNIHLSSEYDIQPVFIGNTGELYQISDKITKKEYYFKPATSKNGNIRPYRASIQEAAYRIGQIINPEFVIKCNKIQINGILGAIQEKIPVDIIATRAFIDYFDNGLGKLSPQIISQIVDEYLVDFCLCNYDAHASNFIIDTNGNLRGVDKEQSFRYIGQDVNKDMMFSTNYNAKYGENFTIYTILFEQMKQGIISYEYLESLKQRVNRLEQFPDKLYRRIFETYAYGKANTPEEAETLLNNILDRKRNIIQNVEKLYSDIRDEYLAHKNSLKTSSLLNSAIIATECSTRESQIAEQLQILGNIGKSKIPDSPEK